MQKITTQQALKLIKGKPEIHCMMTNPRSTPGFIAVGWSKEAPFARESIETSDELFLLEEQEAFCNHRLLCVNPKGKYPDRQVFMEI